MEELADRIYKATRELGLDTAEHITKAQAILILKKVGFDIEDSGDCVAGLGLTIPIDATLISVSIRSYRDLESMGTS